MPSTLPAEQLGLYSIIPYFIGMALLLLIAATPAFKIVDDRWQPKPDRGIAPTVKKSAPIEGLRGFLALGVFFYHVVITRNYIQTGDWAAPKSRFYTMMGQSAVELFFMITGFLFWSKILKEHGRPQWPALYVGRLFRIGPVYLVAIGWMFMIVFYRVDWQFKENSNQFTSETIIWLLLGYFSPTGLNGYKRADLILAGVTWTLHYEWIFYLSLYPLSFFARSKSFIRMATPLFMLTMIISLYLYDGDDNLTYVCWLVFSIGMTVAVLKEYQGYYIIKSYFMSSAIALAMLISAFVLFSNGLFIVPIMLIGIVFYFVANGCSIFNLLTNAPAKRLGNVSYPIYLLQGPVLSMIFYNDNIRAWSLMSNLHFWCVSICAGVVLVSLAALVHVTIERPGMRLGRDFIKTLPSSQGKPTAA